MASLGQPPDDGEQTARRVQPAPLAPRRGSLGSDALPRGTRLGEFEIESLIGKGGFGIVYLANDHSLRRQVALKEYMPAALAMRADMLMVSVKEEAQAEAFSAGLRSFINEAQLLAQFDHPSLVKVHRFWEANGTAYTVMPYYKGITLKQSLINLGGPPEEAWLKGLLRPLLDAIAYLHRAQCYHRDIAPDNILILEAGLPVLLDFGAARKVISDMTHGLTAILKPGYAPIEQYDGMEQGPWTDIYALACVVYFAITGKTPVPSVTRMIRDNLEPLSKLAANRYSDGLLRGIDRAMAVRPEERPQDIAEFCLEIGLADRRERRAFAVPPVPVPASPVETVRASAAVLASPANPGAKRESSTEHSRATVAQALRQSPTVVFVLGAVVLAAAVAAGTKLIPGLHSDTVANVQLPVQVPVPGPHSEQSAAILSRPGNRDSSSAESRQTPVPEPGAAVPAPSGRTWDKPFSPEQMLDDIYEGRDRWNAVSVAAQKKRVQIGKDQVRFRIVSSKPGYVYVLSAGRSRFPFNLLFPNAADNGNRIAPDQPLHLPGGRWPIAAKGPAGTLRLVVMVSDSPREFDSLDAEPDEIFLRFSSSAGERLYRNYRGASPLFAGTIRCAAATPCSQSYGAAQLVIEEIADSLGPRVATAVGGDGKPRLESGVAKGRRAAASTPNRCDDIIHHVSLGEVPTAEDNDFLKRECRR